MPEESKPKSLVAYWPIALWLLAFACLAFDMRVAFNERKLLQTITQISFVEVEAPTPAADKITEHDQRVMAGFYGTQGRPKLELHESHPEHPGYFAQYVYEHEMVYGALPENLLEEAARIDPGNALYHLMKAHEVLGKNVENDNLLPPTPTDWEGEVRIRHRSPPQSYEILDQEAFDEALALVREACERPYIRTYGRDRHREIGEIFKRAGRSDTIPGLMGSLMLWVADNLPALQFKKAQTVICAAAYQAYLKEDREQLLELAALRDKLVRQLSDGEGRMLVDALVYGAVAGLSANDFEHYCRELGLDELAAKYQTQGQALHDRRERCRRSPHVGELDQLFEQKKTSMLQGMMMPVILSQVEEAPEFGEAEMRPLREAEHDFATRSGLRLEALLLLLVAGGIFLTGALLARRPDCPAWQLASSLRPVDWMLICLLGAILPLAAFWVIMQHTPMGGRAVGVFRLLLLHPGLPLACLMALIPITLAHGVRWRIARRQAKPMRKRLYCVVLAVNLLVLPLAWFLSLALSDFDSWHIAWLTYFVCMLTPAISLVTVSALALYRGIRGSSEERTLVSATCLGMARCLPVAIIGCLVAATAFRISETNWIRQERTMRLNVDEEHLGIFEIKLAEQVYRELNAIILPGEQ